MKAKKVFEFIDFKRVGGDDAAAVLGKMGVGKSAVTITWGKHRGKTVGEVYAEDPQYILWMAKEGNPRPGQEAVFNEIHRLAEKFFAAQEEKRKEEGLGTHYGQPGGIFEGSIEVRNTKYFSGEYGESYMIVGKNPPSEGAARHWIKFYANFNNLSKLFDLSPEDGNVYSMIKDKMRDLPGEVVDIKGKIKGHSEWKDQKYTNLNYVKFMSTINEAQEFERGKHPYDALGIGAKTTIELDNGYPYTGPTRNREAAEKIAEEIRKEMDNVRAEYLDDDLSDDAVMNEVDDVIEAYEERLNDLGYEYDEDGWE